MHRPTGIGATRRSFLAGAACAMMGSGALAAPGGRSFFTRHNLAYGVQLFPMSKEVQADLGGTFRKLADMGYRQIETAGLHGHTAGELKAAADATGLKIVSSHVSVQLRGGAQDHLLIDGSGPIIEDLNRMGATNAVMALPLLPDPIPPLDEQIVANIARLAKQFTVADWQRTAEFMNRRGDEFRKAGISFFYHNHNIDFAPVGGTTGWEILMRETDPALVGFEMDIGWVAAAGLDPTALLEKSRGRVGMLHMKDVDRASVPNFSLNQISCPLGQGVVDWPKFLRAARRAGVYGYFVEQEPPFPNGPFGPIKQSVDYLKSLR